MAFQLVDRITQVEPGRAARGVFTVPANVREWPPFLLAEAVGQLAAWSTMAQLDFRLRPVAALAGEVLIGAEVSGGDIVDLSVRIDSIERGGVLYGGEARVGGREALVMRRCVGPLLAMEDFDDPEAARARFAALCEGGGTGAAVVVSAPRFEVLEEIAGERLRAGLDVPLDAPFFADHFPRRPVYPATILLDAEICIGQKLLGHPAQHWCVTRVTHVKISAFTTPGERLEVEAALVSRSGDEAKLQLTGYRAGTRVSRARMEFRRIA